MRTRPLVACFVLSAAFASAREARADDVPAYAKLPVGQLSAPPTNTRKGVGARESVPGVFVVRAQNGVTVTADAAVAGDVRRNGSFELTTSSCVAEVEGRLESEGGDPGAAEWSENLRSDARAFTRTDSTPFGGVTAFHMERLVDHDGSPSLEYMDFWVDPRTHGVRMITKGALPLKLVASPGFGIQVFAARDERPDGKRFVQFVVSRTSVEASTDLRMSATRLDGQSVQALGCAHQRVAVPVERYGDGVTILAPVRLPERRDHDDSRLRDMRVHVSVSQTARDKEPLVAVSAGWSGREQIDRGAEH